MDTPAIRRTLTGVGALYEGESPEARRFLGSCFSVLEPGVFVTAAHCVSDRPVEQMWLNHFGGPPPHCFTRAREVHFTREGDLAVLITDVPSAQWACPFQFVQYAADFGEDVYAIGFPEDRISATEPNKETLRYFRGTVQRPFIYDSRGARYSAFELSFPCPLGLSGGPVFLARDPRTVLGVVTENFETYTVADEEQCETTPGSVRKIQARRIITYGVASNIQYVADVLRQVLGRDVPNRLVDAP